MTDKCLMGTERVASPRDLEPEIIYAGPSYECAACHKDAKRPIMWIGNMVFCADCSPKTATIEEIKNAKKND